MLGHWSCVSPPSGIHSSLGWEEMFGVYVWLLDNSENTGARLPVRNVIYISETDMSMLSRKQPDNVGIFTSFSSWKSPLIDWNKEIGVLRDERRNNDMLYVLSAKLEKDPRSKTCITSNPTMSLSWKRPWHGGLDHPSNVVLERMRKTLVESLNPKSDRDFVQCDVCLEGNLTNSYCLYSCIKKEQDHIVRSNVVKNVRLVPLGSARIKIMFIVERLRITKLVHDAESLSSRWMIWEF